jgi:hypothetical protein
MGLSLCQVKPKSIKIGICRFSAKCTALMSYSKVWLQNFKLFKFYLMQIEQIFQLYHGENKLLHDEMLMSKIEFYNVIKLTSVHK